MRVKKIFQFTMYIGLLLIFFGAITYNLPIANIQLILVAGCVISIADLGYYVVRWLSDLLHQRNTRHLYCFVTKDTAISDRCALPIKKKVELHPDVEMDEKGNPAWQKAIGKLTEQMKEKGIDFKIDEKQFKAIVRICKIVGFNYIYYVELKRKWIWRHSKNDEGFERFIDLTFRKWGDEYPDANIHDEELFGALSDAEVGLCWLVKWGDAREWVPIFHSKMTLQDAHNEIMIANRALKKLGDGGNLTPEEEAELKREAHKGFASVADENQVKEGIILVQNAYASQLSTQDSDLRLENASFERKLGNALDTIEKQRQYEEELFDTDIGMPTKATEQLNGIRISGNALAGIIIAFLGLFGFIGYLLQFTGWF